MVVVTNRKLCKDDFVKRIREIVEAVNPIIILREKDLKAQEYFELAKKLDFVEKLFLQNVEIAKSLDRNIHLPFNQFMNEDLTCFKIKSCSVHSKEEAVKAEKQGASFLLTGHIFETDCKKDLAPRGLDYLKYICDSALIPVVAIGGIDQTNASLVLNSGASSFAIMSSAFLKEDIKDYLLCLKQIEEKNLGV